MAGDVWGRPRIPTGESVAAALRLAEELRPDASLLCEGAGESTELLVRKNGEVRRYVAYASGATEQVETREPSRRYRVGRRLTYAGLMGFPLILAAGFVFRPEASTLLIGTPFLLAWAMVMGGALLSQQWAEIDAPDDVVSAPIPYDLGGWEPRTVAQLAAVEKLSQACDANMRVRHVDNGGVEVETFYKRERRRDVLDAFGVVIEHDVTAVTGGAYWVPRVAALGFVIPFGALLLFDEVRSFFLGMAVYMFLLLVAARIDSRKLVVQPGEEWFEIRVEAPSD
jgi:hypothetical protein